MYQFSASPVLLKPDKKGSKGKYVLLYQGYTYRKCAKTKKGNSWKCTSSKTDDCKAIVVTDESLNVILTKKSHSHGRNAVGDKPKHVYFSADL
ncbi:Mod(Mdg4)-v26 [Operophtera brumata]|uniref:Mod(Mdg4)-v26 n=1 Tax=Operophtera brumata TaxID=104452 RepID=A0A0L7LP93_OPEBR|nr:Mod(Mdg4)-v26 [Operophtera brumata]